MSPGAGSGVALICSVEPVSTPRRCRSKTAVSSLYGELGGSPAARASDVGEVGLGSVARRRVGGKSAAPDATDVAQEAFAAAQAAAVLPAGREQHSAAAASSTIAELSSADADAPAASATRRGSLLKRRRGATVPENVVGSRRSARVAAQGQGRADVLTRAGEGSGARSAGASSGPSRCRIVTGFGSERIDDVVADEQRRLVEGARRGDQRREDGARGRMTSFEGQDLDRGVGGAWHAGRR